MAIPRLRVTKADRRELLVGNIISVLLAAVFRNWSHLADFNAAELAHLRLTWAGS
jgi:hypothetical protein